MSEFGIEAQNADDHEDEEDIGLHDASKEFFARRHFVGNDDGMRKGEMGCGAIETRDGAAIEFGEQIIRGGGHKINEFSIEGFFFAEGLRVGDGGRSEIHVAAALGDVAAQVGSGLVDDFLVHGFIDLNGLAAKKEYG